MTEKMEFYPGFDIRPTTRPFGFAYGEGVFGPAPEIRRLDDIRASLADPRRSMTFGAWCVRDYGFDYRAVRRHGGIAFFPYVDGDTLKWRENPAYQRGELIIEEARTYEDFFLEPGVPIYTQFRKDPDRFLFVSHPEGFPGLWKDVI